MARLTIFFTVFLSFMAFASAPKTTSESFTQLVEQSQLDEISKRLKTPTLTLADVANPISYINSQAHDFVQFEPPFLVMCKSSLYRPCSGGLEVYNTQTEKRIAKLPYTLSDNPAFIAGKWYVRSVNREKLEVYNYQTGELVKTFKTRSRSVWRQDNSMFIFKGRSSNSWQQISLKTLNVLSSGKRYDDGHKRFANKKNKVTVHNIKNWQQLPETLKLDKGIEAWAKPGSFELIAKGKPTIKLHDDSQKRFLKIDQQNIWLSAREEGIWRINTKNLLQQAKQYWVQLETQAENEKALQQAVKSSQVTPKTINAWQQFSARFPNYLSTQTLHKRAQHHLTENPINPKITLKTSVDDYVQGKRYLPEATNSYYATEDQSYTVNGEYVNKLTSKRKKASNGGYNISIKGYDRIFALTNTATTPYLVRYQSAWRGAEKKIEKEEYCARKGFLFCADWHHRYVEKPYYNDRQYQKVFLIAPGGRVKHRYLLGEEKPKKIYDYIAEVKPISQESFKKIQSLYQPSAYGDAKASLALIKALSQKAELAMFVPTLQQRAITIQQEVAKRFDKNHRAAAVLEITPSKNFDPDFESTVQVLIKTDVGSFKAQLATPAGKKWLAVDKRVSGWQAFGYCLLCEWQSQPTTIKVPKGTSKKDLQKQLRIIKAKALTP